MLRIRTDPMKFITWIDRMPDDKKTQPKNAVAQPDISHLSEATEEVRIAALDLDPGPPDPVNFSNLIGRLTSSRDELPALYQQEFFDPYLAVLQAIGRSGFETVLNNDPDRVSTGGLMLDIAHCILQNGEGFEAQATDAFQEVVSDLFNGFLSAGSRVGVKPPDLSMTPPLVKWGNPLSGPYTWTIGAASIFGLSTGVVSLPPSNARGGLLAWGALGHETAGHDILHADTGLLSELATKVFESLDQGNFGNLLPSYWADRIDETGSDVLGVLNLGPTAAIGLIGYFRGLSAAFSGSATLRNVGEAGPHPADILRGFLGAEAVRHLAFDGSDAWGDIILDETKNDVTTIQLLGQNVTESQARKSAAQVAKVIVSEPMDSLEGRSLCQIKNWHNSDEEKVAGLRTAVTTTQPLTEIENAGLCAAHTVAAAVMAALAGDAPIPSIFGRMKAILQNMHNANPVNGPLMVRHSGDLVRHVIFENE